MDTPICPILSVQAGNADRLCVTDACALYLPPAKKCSLVMIGYKAFLEVSAPRPANIAPNA
jgi:hypothetical protein